MKRHYQILMPLLGLFLFRVDLTDLYPLVYEVRLKGFLDTDTAVVRLRKQVLTIRLAKVDAPEKKQNFILSHLSAGELSLNCLKQIIKNKKSFDLIIYGQDIYGRIIGELDDLSLQLITHGCVSLYPHARFENKKERSIFLKALKYARDNGLGLWKYGGFTQPKIWRKKLNKRSERPSSERQLHFLKTYQLDQKFVRKED